MRILKLCILFIFIFSTEMVGQNIVHLCLGSQHNFAVPYNVGSSYNWNIENSAIAEIYSGNGSEQIIIDLKGIGISKLIVEEVNSDGCIGYDSIFIEVHPLPNPIITANGDINFCEGDSVILLLMDDDYVAYSWSPILSSEPFFVVYDSGDYSVTVIDSFGCENTSNVIEVVSQSLLIVDFIVDGVCINTPIKLTNTSTTSLGNITSSIWNLGDGLFMSGDSIYYTYYETGDYEVSLTINTDIGCESSQTKTLSVLENPGANFTYSPFRFSNLYPQVDFINTSINAASYWWQFGDSNSSSYYSPSHIYEDPGIYDVMLLVEDVNECRDSITKQVLISYDFVLHIPTAFTPNNDGENDTFYPRGLRMDKYKSYVFQIYNKWGERIFETDDIDKRWDGARCPSEIYNWVLTIVDELGKVRKESGQVTLIR